MKATFPLVALTAVAGCQRPDSDQTDSQSSDETATAGAASLGVPDAGIGESGGGGCDQPNEELFDPDHALLLGTVSPGSSGKDILCELVPDGTRSVGGSWSTTLPRTRLPIASIHPTTCRLQYVLSGALYEFRSDGAVEAGYPADPVANDILLPSEPCSTVNRFVMHPITGDVFYPCGEHWRDVAGNTLHDCPTGELVSLDQDGAVYCGETLVSPDGVEHAIAGVDPEALFVVRAKPGGGFWGVTSAAEFGEPYSRWSIDSAGTATLDGTYAPFPEGTSPYNADGPYNSGLERAGAFLRAASTGGGTSFVVVRLSADFSSAEVVLDEGNDICQINSSGGFITAP